MEETKELGNQKAVEYDLSIVYDYRTHPDKISGRCDHCNHALFDSSVKKYEYIRKCRNCGMMKSI
ncbi:hypothetical protein [Metabacillus endolithicus]|uniref:DUF8096 domain-containing protein n=1 Tax=Metabacillus endolithicus TaxID=1535204 RepID=A0ABW5C683_9BACI|nr:hypothetical protein [Metabacillus endolithicus]UPG66183.1 hypothetical protein MVE64_26095 [Metabacillus endolithicus]